MRILLGFLLACGPAIGAAQEFQYSHPGQGGYAPATYSGGYATDYPQGYGQASHAYPGGPAYTHDVAPCYAEGCGHCCAQHCATGRCLHRSGMFAEFLYWQVNGADVAFAVPQEGIGAAGTVPVGGVGVLDYDHEASFRVGLNLAMTCNTSITASYTKFETNANFEVFANAPQVIQPLVVVPGTFNAGFTAQAAGAESALKLELIDMELRTVLHSGRYHHLNGIIGMRYGELDQSFASIFPFAPPDGTTFVLSELDFTGIGLRCGVEGERFLLPHLGIAAYGKFIGGMLGGDFQGSFLQFNQFNGVEAATTWEDARLVPTVEGELGLSWVNRKDTFRLSAGYYMSIWSNVVTTSEWINGVQNLNFVDIGRDEYDSLRFDGLVARAELRL